jgi:Zn-dependent peptidase ImmA (M78 family)/transcriptional regulator with XRE-family HTH domain
MNPALPPVTRPFNPDFLILARESRGLTQTDLAERVGLSQSLLSKLEHGTLPASVEQVQFVARELHYPVGFFYRKSEPLIDSVALFRRYSSVSATLLRRVRAHLELMKANLSRLLDACEPIEIRVELLEPAETDGGAFGVARECRKRWQVPGGPIRNLTALVESLGCFVIAYDFATRRIDGFSDVVNGHPVIFLNRALGRSRLRFTLAHELGHLVMHRTRHAETEEEAHKFASEFLMPAEEIKPTFLPMSIDRLARLKLYWHVSMQALLKHAQNLGVISERTARYYWSEINRRGYRENEPFEDMIPAETGSSLKRLIEMFITDLGLSLQELADRLTLHLNEFLEIFDVDTQNFSPPLLKFPSA